MQLPARCRTPLRINLVETIPEVNTQRSEWAQGTYSKSSAPEQPRRVELTRLVPHVATLEEGVEVERLIDAQSYLSGADEERVAERRYLSLILVRVRIEPVRRDRELVVAAELLAVLRAAHRKSLRIEEWTGVAEDRSCPRRQTDHEHHRLA